ncbi:MAG TPA: C45 family peptidase [Planctomycetota bacterium]|nr:C45 family peptidase [Planctomycetota bacterium]
MRLPLFALFLLALAPQERAFEDGVDGRASLHYVGPVPVLQLYGTPGEMGAQYGRLLKKPIAALYRELVTKFLAGMGGAPVEKKLREETQGMAAAVPASIAAEMKAAARESGLAFDDYMLFNTMFDVEHGGRRLGGCSTMAVTGAASASGEPMMGRNFDLPQPFWSLSPVGLVVVRHPAKGLAWASVTHPLFAGTHAGLNEKGLAAGATAGVSGSGYAPNGLPSMMLFRRVLEEASTAAEAETMLKGAKVTVSTTLMVLDAKGGNFVAELSPEKVAFRRPEQETLHETNHFRSPELFQKVDCPRFRWLDEHFKGRTGIDEEGMKKALAGAAPGINLQSMILYPSRRSLLLSSGTIPAAKGAFAALSAEDLFGNH